MTGLVDRSEDRGLMAREPNEDDGRAIDVFRSSAAFRNCSSACSVRIPPRLMSNRQAFLALQSVADEIAIGATQSTLGSAPSGSQDWVVDSTVAMISAGEIRDGSKAFGVTPPFHCVARR